jgi:hypothetical protein
MGDLFAIRVKQHLVKAQLLACLAPEQVHVYDIAWRDAILPTAGFYDCVSHKEPRKKSRETSMSRSL